MRKATMNTMNLKQLMAAALVCAAVATSACAATGKERSTGAVIDDSVIGAKVKTALIESPDTKARQIDVKVNKGTVMLAGAVETQAEKAQAGMLARKVEGVHDVQNSLTVGIEKRTAGEVVDDASLTARVKAALVGNTITKARQIDVDTHKGVVELHGFVDSQAEINEALKEARAVSGVVDVRNDLEVKSSN
jgi:hyperosmotically inducible periplasmic protein